MAAMFNYHRLTRKESSFVSVVLTASTIKLFFLKIQSKKCSMCISTEKKLYDVVFCYKHLVSKALDASNSKTLKYINNFQM